MCWKLKLQIHVQIDSLDEFKIFRWIHWEPHLFSLLHLLEPLFTIVFPPLNRRHRFLISSQFQVKCFFDWKCLYFFNYVVYSNIFFPFVFILVFFDAFCQSWSSLLVCYLSQKSLMTWKNACVKRLLSVWSDFMFSSMVVTSCSLGLTIKTRQVLVDGWPDLCAPGGWV